MFSLSTSAPPLTVDTVLTAVQGVNWRRLGERLLPDETQGSKVIYPKLDEIEQLYQSNGDRLRAVIKCWIQDHWLDEQPSWRKIIHALDSTDEMRIADNIQHFAEPVSGKSCDSISVSTF